MKKVLTCILVTLCALTAGEAEAQSFLKKIGKTVEKEIVKEVNKSKNKKEKKQSKVQETSPQKQEKTASSNKNSYKSVDPTTINVPISEVYNNAQFYNEGPTGAGTTIDGIEYVIFTDKKYAYLSCVEKSMRGKTDKVKVWGGIRYKGVVYPVTYIKAHAFEGESLTAVELPSNLQEICEEAFCYSKLKSVVIHGATWRIGASAFAATPLESVRISNGVKKIEANVFAGCKNLTNVVIPESVTSIDRSVFMDCEKLKEVVLPRNITRIPISMFEGCSSLTSYSIPGNIEKIENSAFSNSGLKSIIIPLGVKSIGDAAFQKCQNLTSVTIPSSVESFGDFIFTFCNKLSTVRIHEKHKDIDVLAKIFMGTDNILVSDKIEECNAIIWTN